MGLEFRSASGGINNEAKSPGITIAVKDFVSKNNFCVPHPVTWEVPKFGPQKTNQADR